MAKYLRARDIDMVLFVIVLLICAVGVLQIYSATLDTKFHGAWWKQIDAWRRAAGPLRVPGTSCSV